MTNEKINLRDGYRLADRVYSHLRNGILKGELKPGARLVETNLAKLLGVSRSPVRDAITRLEQDGYVVIRSLKVTVREIPPTEIIDLFVIRCALEGMAAWLATPVLSDLDLRTMEDLCFQMEKAESDSDQLARLGNEFHDVFIHSCKNTKLNEMLIDIKEQIYRFRSVSAAKPGRGTESTKEHWEVLEAMKEGDALRAEQLVRQHILSAQKTLLMPK